MSKTPAHMRLFLALRRLTISSMKGTVFRYWSGVTLAPCWQIARSCKKCATQHPGTNPTSFCVLTALTRCAGTPHAVLEQQVQLRFLGG